MPLRLLCVLCAPYDCRSSNTLLALELALARVLVLVGLLVLVSGRAQKRYVSTNGLRNIPCGS